MSRYDALLQIWQPRFEGAKPACWLQMIYKSGQSNQPEYALIIANHYNYPVTDAKWTGRISFALDVTDWDGQIQAKETANSDPLSLGMDTTVDGAYASLHGFKIESIPPGGSRLVLVKFTGSSLTYNDVLQHVTLRYPVAA